MTFHDYLLQNLISTVMISLSVDEQESFQYNYWNWFHQVGEFHLLKNDFTIGHILHYGSIEINDNGSAIYSSLYYPKKCLLNFYFGGVKL